MSTTRFFCNFAMLKRFYFMAAMLVAALAPARASASTTLRVIQGSGEFRSFQTAISVSAPLPLQLVWSTSAANVVSVSWQVTTVNSANQTVVVAQGQTPGNGGYINLPQNAFLQAVPPPAPGKNYSITVTPLNAQQQPVDAASAPVVITQVQEQPSPPVNFGPPAVFPDLELVHYQENFGVPQATQLYFEMGVVKVRAVNHGAAATDPVLLYVQDANGLMKQTTPHVAVPALKPGAAMEFTFNLTGILAAPESQTPGEQQFDDWIRRYRVTGGVDLRGLMDWDGSPASTPADSHRNVYLYHGLGDSTACQDGKFDPRNAPADTPVCDGSVCISMAALLRNIHQRLDCRVVGYSFFFGRSLSSGVFQDFGHARTAADAPPAPFTHQTKMTVASVSKVITTLAAIRVMDNNGVHLKDAIGPHLPKSWNVSPTVAKLTFQQLFTHTSGIRDYGNNSQDYVTLLSFFTQPVDPKANTSCPHAVVDGLPNPINATHFDTCYSNYNFSIFRILLPLIDRRVKDGDGAEAFANAYVQIVQDNVFKPLGIQNVTCAPPQGAPYAIAYKFPGNTSGFDWRDLTPNCGAAGWYLSVEDLAKVLLSLNMQDGKVLAETEFMNMENFGLGWDQLVTGNNIRYLEKNGGFGDNDGHGVSTSIAIFGPELAPGLPFAGVLFLDSDITHEPGIIASGVLGDAITQAITSN